MLVDAQALSVEAALLQFTGAAMLSTMVPGADTILVLRAAAGRPQNGVRAALGIALGCLTWGLLTAIGVTAFISRSPVVAAAVQGAGGAYLIYLGTILVAKALRGQSKPTQASEATPSASWFRRAYTTNILNPKVGLFYLAIVPSFATVSAQSGLFAFLLASIHAATAIVWMSFLSLATGRARNLVGSRYWASALEGLAGSALVVIGVAFLVRLL